MSVHTMCYIIIVHTSCFIVCKYMCLCTHAHTDRHRHTHTQTDTHRQTHTHRQTDRQTDRHTHTHTHTHTHGPTHKQAHMHMHTQTHTHIPTYINQLLYEVIIGHYSNGDKEQLINHSKQLFKSQTVWPCVPILWQHWLYKLSASGIIYLTFSSGCAIPYTFLHLQEYTVTKY